MAVLVGAVMGAVLLLPELLVGVTEAGVTGGGWRLRVALLSERSEAVFSLDDSQLTKTMDAVTRTARYFFINVLLGVCKVLKFIQNISLIKDQAQPPIKGVGPG